jgi:hypothetical protein
MSLDASLGRTPSKHVPIKALQTGKKAHHKWHTPKLFDGLNCKSKGENNIVGTHSLTHNTLGVEGRVKAPKWD